MLSFARCAACYLPLWAHHLMCMALAIAFASNSLPGCMSFEGKSVLPALAVHALDDLSIGYFFSLRSGTFRSIDLRLAADWLTGYVVAYTLR